MNFSQLIKDTLLSNPIQINHSLIIDVFEYQYQHCNLYNEYCKRIQCNPANIKNIDDIPFLPITFFKNFKVITDISEKNKHYTRFESSGTTGMQRSTHWVMDEEWYKKRSVQLFESFYGQLKDWTIFPMVASYQDNPHSSLLFMLNEFLKRSKVPSIPFYTSYKDIPLELLNTSGKKMIWGVTYALLDWSEQSPCILDDQTVILETGGMKGKRLEMHRMEVHDQLKKAFGVATIHSEYGMTELLSQAYSQGNGMFQLPSGIIPLVRDMNDPFSVSKKGRGGLNIIDLANIDSCCFIETQDYAQVSDKGFEILGRLTGSESRGCNLMYES
jgi:phenylacetate-coenzyme A ligase PaaK-like adenylate-forming protein